VADAVLDEDDSVTEVTGSIEIAALDETDALVEETVKVVWEVVALAAELLDVDEESLAVVAVAVEDALDPPDIETTQFFTSITCSFPLESVVGVNVIVQVVVSTPLGVFVDVTV